MVDWLLKGEPRAVQLEALRRSYYGENGYGKGWAHFLQMRLGKTPIMLAEFELFRRDHGFKWGLCLTPNKFKLDWPLEAQRFGLSCPSFAFESSERARAVQWLNKVSDTGGLLAVNYEALNYKDNMEILRSIVGPKTLIWADESITIKNADGFMAKYAIELAKECGARRVLSGKPFSQGPHDIWAQLRFIGELDGFNYYAFRNTFCKMGGFRGKQIKGARNEERLSEILSKCAFIARRSDWMRTPGVDYLERFVALPDNMTRMYRSMQEEFYVELHDGSIVTAEQAITKLIKMQQISSGFIFDENGRAKSLIEPSKNPKALEVCKILEDEIEDKMIVFCHFRPSMEILKEVLAPFEPAFIAGGMSNEAALAEKNRFNTDPNCRVVIGNEQAIRYGHTLQGSPDSPCYTEVFYENNYSLNDRSQCEERPQGAGQEFPITVIDLFTTQQDLAPIRALQRKEDVVASIMKYDRSLGVLPPRPVLRGDLDVPSELGQERRA